MMRTRWTTMVAAAGLLAAAGCGEAPAGRGPGIIDELGMSSPAARWTPAGHSGAASVAAIELTSPAFENGGVLPARHTCQGGNLSPALRWGNVPEGTRSLVVLMEDPSAPLLTYSHWVLFNLPPTLTDLPEGLSPTATPGVPEGAPADALRPVQGTNGGHNLGYDGPCPAEGQSRRYVIHLYALDTTLGLDTKTTRDQLLDTIDGHVLGEGRITTLYPAPAADHHDHE